MIDNLLKRISNLYLFFGKITSLLNVVLVLLVVTDVLLRYYFLYSQAWLTELEWHVFALIFLLGATYTLQYDSHVRVDLFYNGLSKKTQTWINLVGTLVFLLPWCLIVIISSENYAHNSFLINETSADPGGLPYRFVIKYAILVSYVFLFFYGIVFICKSILVLRGKDISLFIETESK
ncbi:TRAP transporter small permease subunit [Membranihabitans maritimus]|uniref:TRAP transporter small permease subunit n=1 Tax=Membranihabitans maritimus TaxID=2904244 RepID=UPI001F3E13CD|nr:TRAP transporter small permease subunit [Membranihabitans maritimus]